MDSLTEDALRVIEQDALRAIEEFKSHELTKLMKNTAIAEEQYRFIVKLIRQGYTSYLLNENNSKASGEICTKLLNERFPALNFRYIFKKQFDNNTLIWLWSLKEPIDGISRDLSISNDANPRFHIEQIFEFD